MMSALAGLRVLELAVGWAGPLAGRLLAQLGADVVKLEEPKGDWLRQVWPKATPEHSHAFELTSAEKRSVAFDHRNDEADGKRARELIGHADVVIIDQAWIDPSYSMAGSLPELMAGAPRTVFCSVTPFGRDGAWRDHAACDLTLQALTGVMASTGMPGGLPARAGPTIVDHCSALYANAAVLAALEERRQSGRGQLIDISSHDCIFSYLFLFLSPLFAQGTVPDRQGNRHLTCAPWSAYPCLDGWVLVCTSTDQQWRTIARLCQHPELESDARFASTPQRMDRVDEVDAIVSDWTRQYSVADVLEALRAANIPAAPIANLKDLFENEQFRARGLLSRVTVRDGQELYTSGLIYKLSESPARDPAPAPLVGANTAAVVQEWRNPSADLLDRPFAAVTGQRALEGLVVVELGAYGAGPFATRLLAELGAEVIKVEPPKGDPVRHFQPPLHGVSYPYQFYNLNKKGVTLDLKTEVGRSALLTLLNRADVFLENLAPGTVDSWGLDYRSIAKQFPRLIYCSVSGFGHSGPYAGRRAYDTTIQALSAVMSLTGRADDSPTKIGLPVADLLGPTAACGAILGALYQRHQTGRGQFVDVSMMDVMAWTTQSYWPAFMATGKVPTREGDAHPAIFPHGSFTTLDGRMVLAAEREEHWPALARLCGESLDHLRDLDVEERLARRDEIEPHLTHWAAQGTTRQRVQLCQSQGIPAAAVLDFNDVVMNDQTRSRELIVDVPDACGRPVRVIQSAFRMSRTPGRMYRSGPGLGEHNDECLHRPAQAVEAAQDQPT